MLVLLALPCRGYALPRDEGAHLHLPIILDMQGCERAFASELRRILIVELKYLPQRAPATGVARIVCQQDAYRVSIQRASSRHHELVQRIEALGTPERGRARRVAIALAEMLDETRIATARRPGSPPTRRPRRAPSLPSTSRLGVEALVVAGGMGAPLAPQVGGALALTYQFIRWIGLRGDFLAAHARRKSPLGRVDLLSLSGSLALATTLRLGRLDLSAALGFRAGAVNLAGDAALPTQTAENAFWAPWVGSLGAAQLGVRLRPRWSLVVGLEGGIVLLPVTGLVDGDREFAQDGYWVTAGLGVRYWLSDLPPRWR